MVAQFFYCQPGDSAIKAPYITAINIHVQFRQQEDSATLRKRRKRVGITAGEQMTQRKYSKTSSELEMLKYLLTS